MSELRGELSVRRKARAALRGYENLRWESLPLRVRLICAVAFPVQTARILRQWFREATAQPGDRFSSLTRYVELLVVEVKPGAVTCEVAARQMIEAWAPDWPHTRPAGVVPCFETFPRYRGWWVP